MTPEGIWRVVCEDGRTHEVAVVPVTGGYSPWRAVCGPVGGSSYDRTPRAAVQSIVRMAAWVPLEILAPGERTREEAARALRMVTGERDEAARTVGRLMADGKALADEVERLRAQLAARPADDPEADGTDAAHPAWWRGQDAGCKGSLALVRRLRVEVDALKGEANITRDEVCALAVGVGVPEGDHDIVDATAVLVACPKEEEGEELRSGTWATVRYARRRHRPVYVVRPSGRVEEERVPPPTRLATTEGDPAR